MKILIVFFLIIIFSVIYENINCIEKEIKEFDGVRKGYSRLKVYLKCIKKLSLVLMVSMNLIKSYPNKIFKNLK